jgi:hypothetical protein
MRRSSVALLVAAALLMVAVPRPAGAVAFNVRNNSTLTLRVRVNDRGRWHPWITCPPNSRSLALQALITL